MNEALFRLQGLQRIKKNAFLVKFPHSTNQIASCVMLTALTEKEIPMEVYWNFSLPYECRTYIQLKT
jgi:hypothetical protein